MAKAVPEACLQAQAMPAARRLEELRHQQRGGGVFLLTTET